ncbi:hypothetical protein KAU87_01485, partial [Candidatus Bathyarchaeota archaeon]|nr:hypothetical protein [Candidatus Bathyarchaeota archaeon]
TIPKRLGNNIIITKVSMNIDNHIVLLFNADTTPTRSDCPIKPELPYWIRSIGNAYIPGLRGCAYPATFKYTSSTFPCNSIVNRTALATLM